MASDYDYGKQKELQVGEFLEHKGYAWGRAIGSRGPADLVAKKGRQNLVIQVKSTRDRSISYTRLTPDEEAKLLGYTDGNKAVPILALVIRNYVWFLSVPDGEEILKGKLKPLKYEYPDET
jgi:Holliday junction resolvase